MSYNSFPALSYIQETRAPLSFIADKRSDIVVPLKNPNVSTQYTLIPMPLRQIKPISQPQIYHPVSNFHISHNLAIPKPMYQNENFSVQKGKMIPSYNQLIVNKSEITNFNPQNINTEMVLRTSPKKKKTTQNDVFTIRVIRNGPKFNEESLPFDSCYKTFFMLYNNKSFFINPKKLDFLPSHFWPDQSISFYNIVEDFFRRKNHINSRFTHKLYNALKLNQLGEIYKDVSGVEWISPEILKVNKIGFARLLGITSIEGSLFHKQGNFSTHGFVELGLDDLREAFGEARAKELIRNSDYRYLKHSLGLFTESVTEEDINNCKWISSKKRK
jgi:hypothetical protein